jgi:hypothetical protein
MLVRSLKAIIDHLSTLTAFQQQFVLCSVVFLSWPSAPRLIHYAVAKQGLRGFTSLPRPM